MNSQSDEPGDPLREQLDRVDRQIRRDSMQRKIQEAGGLLFGADSEEVSDAELSFLERVLAWETGPSSSNRAWLARNGLSFIPPAELTGWRWKEELWRLIHALAAARVFLHHTNHLSEGGLYAKRWADVLPAECPDCARSRDDACHWDLADPSAGDEQSWLRYYASAAEREDWQRMFPDVVLPVRSRPPYRRDHRLPQRD